MGLAQRVTKLTPAEYLARERVATFRSEFYRGEMFAMAGGSIAHSLIKSNILGSLWGRLRGKSCRPHDSDLRIKCPTGLYTYPDVSVICANAEFEDEESDTVLNPTILFEVLSKSTEAWDRGKKFDHYLTIPSLREFLFVSQYAPLIQKYVRNTDETWTLTIISGMDQILKLNSIGVELPLADVFEGLEFLPEELQQDGPLPSTSV